MNFWPCLSYRSHFLFLAKLPWPLNWEYLHKSLAPNKYHLYFLENFWSIRICLYFWYFHCLFYLLDWYLIYLNPESFLLLPRIHTLLLNWNPFHLKSLRIYYCSKIASSLRFNFSLHVTLQRYLMISRGTEAWWDYWWVFWIYEGQLTQLHC